MLVGHLYIFSGKMSIQTFLPILFALELYEFFIHFGYWPLIDISRLPGGSAGKESTCNAGDLGSIPGLGRSSREDNGYPLQYSGLENSMNCIVQGIAKCQKWLSDFHFHQYIICKYSLPFDSFPFCWWFPLLFRSFLVWSSLSCLFLLLVSYSKIIARDLH